MHALGGETCEFHPLCDIHIHPSLEQFFSLCSDLMIQPGKPNVQQDKLLRDVCYGAVTYSTTISVQ
uniref:Uncharacterized protein n=1 Tax=Setaria italica TaxID=4555 RepID=K4AN89_SETIT